MHENLLPDDIKLRIIQVELNPGAVAMNRAAHPDARIVKGSYLHLTEVDGITRESLDLVTGLSTLDATYFPRRAIEQILEVLKPGGHFLHFQDVRPGQGVIAQELFEQGFVRKGEQVTALVEPKDRTAHDIRGYEIARTIYSVVELFRMRMDRVLRQIRGAEVLLNDWVRARKRETKKSLIYHGNYYIEALQAGVQFTEASGIVTLVKKVA